MSLLLGRGAVVIAGLAAGLVVLATTSRTWVRADLTGTLAGAASATVSGTEAAPVVAALALAAMAAASAVSIAGRVARVVAGAVVLLAGAGVLVAAAAVARNPAGAAATAISRSTGGTGVPASAVHATAWPWVACAAGVLVGLVGLGVLLLGRRWEVRRRFEPAPAGERAAAARPAAARAADGDPAATWDALSGGEDPTVEPPRDRAAGDGDPPRG